MRALAITLDPRTVEAEVRQLWSGRGLPPASDDHPNRGGSPTHLAIGAMPSSGDISLAHLQRGLLADVAMRT
ncbi:MAG TPA: hypothetical protein VKT21_05610, partial [Thermoplasmata archaeon]|nr:hypothetical protein [Thermoplasmata archaeon]